MAFRTHNTSGLRSAEGSAHSRLRLTPTALVRRWPRRDPSGFMLGTTCSVVAARSLRATGSLFIDLGSLRLTSDEDAPPRLRALLQIDGASGWLAGPPSYVLQIAVRRLTIECTADLDERSFASALAASATMVFTSPRALAEVPPSLESEYAELTYNFKSGQLDEAIKLSEQLLLKNPTVFEFQEVRALALKALVAHRRTSHISGLAHTSRHTTRSVRHWRPIDAPLAPHWHPTGLPLAPHRPIDVPLAPH